MSLVALLKLAAFLALVSASAWTDARERRIPNRITVSGLAAGVLLASFLESGLPSQALLGAAAGLVTTFPLFALGAIGAGDAKLFTAIGAFLGPLAMVSAALYAGVLGGVLVLLVSIREGSIVMVLVGSRDLLVHTATLGRYGHRPTLLNATMPKIPYGVAIAGGAILGAFLPLLGPQVFFG